MRNEAIRLGEKLAVNNKQTNPDTNMYKNMNNTPKNRRKNMEFKKTELLSTTQQEYAYQNMREN